MAKEIKTQIIINASPEKVWSVLTDLKSYAEWNPFIKSIEGDLESGKRLKIKISPPGGSTMNFKPKVLELKAGKELKWLGHLLIPRLFDGEHKFELIEQKDATTLFIQSERFSGVLTNLLPKKVFINTEMGFQQMNQGLKERVESQ